MTALAMSVVEPAQRAQLDAHPGLLPFIKWPGGKTDELPAISAAAPLLTGRYIDAFVGGGSVLLATPAEVPAWANDACADLVSLYETSAGRDSERLRLALDGLAMVWDSFGDHAGVYADIARAFLNRNDADCVAILSAATPRLAAGLGSAGPALPMLFASRLERDLPTKLRRMRQVEATVGTVMSAPDVISNVEGAIRAAFYMAARSRYNTARVEGCWDAYRSADFLFLREFAYAAMFRFNRRDEFNVPYGGMTYNRKSFTGKVDRLFGPAMQRRLSATVWRSVDFEPFLAEAEPSSGDFVFVDPPYDSDFSAYDNRSFDRHDQERLSSALRCLDAHVMVVIKDTPMIRSLYSPDRWRVVEASKTYMWTIKSRNDRAATHLTITNY